MSGIGTYQDRRVNRTNRAHPDPPAAGPDPGRKLCLRRDCPTASVGAVIPQELDKGPLHTLEYTRANP
jgi:hypothetical protein